MFSEIKDMYLKDSTEHVPTLDEVLYEFRGECKFDIEIKSYDTAEVVVKSIRKIVTSGIPYDNFLVTSFKWKEIKTVRRLDENIPVGLIPTFFPYSAVEDCVNIQSKVVVLNHRYVTRELVHFANNLGVDIYTYTVNKPADIERLVSCGVHAIITDDIRLQKCIQPKFAKELIEDLKTENLPSSEDVVKLNIL